MNNKPTPATSTSTSKNTINELREALRQRVEDLPFRTRYEPSEDPGISFDPDIPEQRSLTKQQFKEDADINNILRKYETQGLLPELMAGEPQYGDFTEVPEYLEALNIVNTAQQQFAALPSEVRDRFGNDPARFLEFTSNPENSEELVKMGLATLPEPPREDPGHKLLGEIRDELKRPRGRPRKEEDHS